MKRIISFLLALCIALSLMGCGSSQNAAPQTASDASQESQTGTEAAASQESSEPAASQEPQTEAVERIAFTTESGTLQYIGWELADSKLTEESNAILVKFAFTNLEDRPRQCQNSFWLSFYQNGNDLEIDKTISYSSEGGEQYNLVNRYFAMALKGGTVEFARIIVPDDDSSITIHVQQKGPNGGQVQSMELDITGQPESFDAVIGEAAPGTENENTVERINFSTPKGSVTYLGGELLSSEKAEGILVGFAFTNQQEDAAAADKTFEISLFQNGVELVGAILNLPLNTQEQMDLIMAYSFSVAKGETIAFGKPVILEDHSPVTVLIQETNVRDGDYQMMVIPIADTGSGEGS